MSARFPWYLAAALCAALAACDSTAPNPAGRAADTVDIGASASVRINGRPLARAASGHRAGRPLLAADCAAGEALRRSPDVRINGAPATTLEPGAKPPACRLSGDAATSADVKAGG